MKWSLLLGVVVLFTASCGTETARSPEPSGADTASPASPAPAPSLAETAAAAATTPKANETPASAPEPGTEKSKTAKPSAPVTITAAIRQGAADLDVVFGSEGTGVLIKVWGVDGLKVTKGATPVAQGSVTNGQSVKIAVQFDAPTTESNLAVSVSGSFLGREQTKVQSFTINAGSPQAQTPPGESTTDKDGRRVKVMKAK